MPDTADDSGADGMRVDRDGRLYVATRMGIQVCDQAGRVNCIIPTPNGKDRQPLLRRRRTSTRSSPPAATASTSGRSRSRARTPTRPRSSPRHPGCDHEQGGSHHDRRNIDRIDPLCRILGLTLGTLAALASSPRPRSTPGARTSPPEKGWIALFNGKDLDGWTPKIKGYPAGENYGNTFRVEDGVSRSPMTSTPSSTGKFGHLFSKTPFSHYRLRIEYRFVGDQCPGGPSWAFRNSGVMIHGQIAREHEEGPGLPGLDRGPVPRRQRPGQAPDGNVCTPGTNIVMGGKLITQHCTDSKSKTYHGDQWVTVEVEVHGNGVIKHIVDGETVLEYEKPQLDDRRRRRPPIDQGRRQDAPRRHDLAPVREPPDRVSQGGDLPLKIAGRAPSVSPA